MAKVPALKRGIRFRDLTLFYVASSLSIRWTATAAAAGPSSLLIFVAAVVCFFIPLAATVMELSSRYPQEGGLYIWTQRAFGDGHAFLAAWTYWMSNLAYFASVLYFGAASALFAFGPRAQSLSADPIYFILFATIALALITLLNIRGVNAGKWLGNIATLGGIVPLALLLLLGAISYFRFGSATPFNATTLTVHWSLKDAIFWSAIFYAFVGLEAGSAMGDEIENPRRTIPWAILAGGAITAIGYIGGTAALLIAVPSSAVDGPDGFIHGIGILCSRLHVSALIPIAAILLAFNAVAGASAYLSSTSRLPFVAGIDLYLPPIFGSIHPRFRTPWVAIAVYGLAGILVALLGQAGTNVRGAYDVLVSMTVLTTFLPFLYLFGAMIRLQFTSSGAPQDSSQHSSDKAQIRRVPGGKPVAIALATLGLASTVLTIFLSAIPSEDDPNKTLTLIKVVGGSAFLVMAGLITFLIGRSKGRKLRQAAHLTTD